MYSLTGTGGIYHRVDLTTHGEHELIENLCLHVRTSLVEKAGGQFSLGATVSGAGKPLCTMGPSSNPECSASLISLAATPC